MVNTIIVFYSLEGFTKQIAKYIAKETKGDLLELEPKKTISKGFMKYFRGGKQVIMKEIPTLKAYDVNFNKYETIYIGTPVWSFIYTPAIRSFIKKKSLKNKKIIIFCTHEGGPGKTLNNLEKEFSGNTIIAKKDFNRRFLEKDIELLHKEIKTILI
ncbi:MAG: flavodoxin [Candidatus Absconditabacteria bacterium]|nr:flavodoxin [Candidatus Absconditabacteria bacterium]